MQRYKLNMAHH